MFIIYAVANGTAFHMCKNERDEITIRENVKKGEKTITFTDRDKAQEWADKLTSRSIKYKVKEL